MCVQPILRGTTIDCGAFRSLLFYWLSFSMRPRYIHGDGCWYGMSSMQYSNQKNCNSSLENWDLNPTKSFLIQFLHWNYSGAATYIESYSWKSESDQIHQHRNNVYHGRKSIDEMTDCGDHAGNVIKVTQEQSQVKTKYKRKSMLHIPVDIEHWLLWVQISIKLAEFSIWYEIWMKLIQIPRSTIQNSLYVIKNKRLFIQLAEQKASVLVARDLTAGLIPAEVFFCEKWNQYRPSSKLSQSRPYRSYSFPSHLYCTIPITCAFIHYLALHG